MLNHNSLFIFCFFQCPTCNDRGVAPIIAVLMDQFFQIFIKNAIGNPKRSIPYFKKLFG